MTALVWDLRTLWQYVSFVGGLLDAAGEKIRYVGYPGTWWEGVVLSIRFVYGMYTVCTVYIRIYAVYKLAIYA
jgi:hypothetical protein